MKKIIYGPIMIISLLVGISNISAQTIKIGYFPLPPFQYLDESTQTHKGASYAYFEAIASKLGYEIEWNGPLPIARLYDMLKKGRVDASILFEKNTFFAPFFYFSTMPVFYAKPTLFVLKDNPLSQIRSIEDIQGYTIGTIVDKNKSYIPLMDNHGDVLTIEALGSEKWIEQNLYKLISGRVDAIFDRQPYSVPFVAAEMKFANRIKLLFLPGPAVPLYIVFSKASGIGQTLHQQCNELLPQFELNFEKLVQQELKTVTQAVFFSDQVP